MTQAKNYQAKRFAGQLNTLHRERFNVRYMLTSDEIRAVRELAQAKGAKTFDDCNVILMSDHSAVEWNSSLDRWVHNDGTHWKDARSRAFLERQGP